MNVTGKRRVSNVKVNGKDLDLNRIYNVSMSEFIGSGGDGYTMFAKYEVLNESLMTDIDALSYYVKNELNCIIPEKYKYSLGRINIVNAFVSSSIPISTVPILTISISTVSKNNSDFIRYNYRKKSGGLSTGGIIAIIIPLMVALVAITIISFIYPKKIPPNKIITSDSDIKIN